MTEVATGALVDGRYRILRRIGSGGMAEVYAAEDTHLGREVALKFSAEQFSERFEREARAVAALNHPNICTLHDVAPNYLVMELVEGPVSFVDTRNNKRSGKAWLKPVQTVTAGVPFGRPYNSPFAVR